MYPIPDVFLCGGCTPGVRTVSICLPLPGLAKHARGVSLPSGVYAFFHLLLRKWNIAQYTTDLKPGTGVCVNVINPCACIAVQRFPGLLTRPVLKLYENYGSIMNHKHISCVRWLDSFISRLNRLHCPLDNAASQRTYRCCGLHTEEQFIFGQALLRKHMG